MHPDPEGPKRCGSSISSSGRCITTIYRSGFGYGTGYRYGTMDFMRPTRRQYRVRYPDLIKTPIKFILAVLFSSLTFKMHNFILLIFKSLFYLHFWKIKSEKKSK
jgi:hypothetical protein